MARLLIAAALWIGCCQAATPTCAVLLHSSNPNARLELRQLRSFFLGYTRNWPDGSKVILVVRDGESAAFTCLLRRVLAMSAAEYKRHLAGIEFSGEAPLPIKVLRSEAGACKYVANVPGSIAVIETNSLRDPVCGGLQTARVDGKLPGEEGYPLR